MEYQTVEGLYRPMSVAEGLIVNVLKAQRGTLRVDNVKDYADDPRRKGYYSGGNTHTRLKVEQRDFNVDDR